METADRKHHGNDTYALPPQAICDLYKKYQKMADGAVDGDLDVVDFNRGLTEAQRAKIVHVDTVPSELITAAQKAFEGHGRSPAADRDDPKIPPACNIYEHQDFPESQWMMLDHLLHRELSNPLHTNNLSHDYTIPYPPQNPHSTPSFFRYPQSHKDQTFNPVNPLSSHKALNTAQFLQKKLRWLTLGSQYEWNTRSYPSSSPTPFPADIAELVMTLFKASFVPESGVVLLYSPKDYMPVHRDVSEESPRGLASFTLGCDGLFIIAKEDHLETGNVSSDDSELSSNGSSARSTTQADSAEKPMIVIRVRSGDVVHMDGPTRWAWHAMPKVMAGTCPEALQSWPVKEGGGTPREYERWKGYMRSKRLNISCRQVWDDSSKGFDDD